MNRTETFYIKSGNRYLSNVTVNFLDLRNRVRGKFNPVFSDCRIDAYRFRYLIDAKNYADIWLNPEHGPYTVGVDFDATL